MARFDCNGWLYVAVCATSPKVQIKLRHEDTHPAYLDIQLPDQWKAFIEANAETLTAGQVSVQLVEGL